MNKLEKKNATFITSDLHLCHKNIINLCNRPFKDVNEMHDTLIKNWNSVVDVDDETYILGDVSYKGNPNTVKSILNQLNGKIYLVRGNHDKDKYLKKFGDRFEWIKDYYELYYNSIRIVMFHYAIHSFNGMYKDAIQLFGHHHSQDKYLGKGRSMNVCVDAHNFTPVNLDWIMDIMKDRKPYINENYYE